MKLNCKEEVTVEEIEIVSAEEYNIEAASRKRERADTPPKEKKPRKNKSPRDPALMSNQKEREKRATLRGITI